MPLIARTISIAPMMAYTDRHYRYLMRIISKHTLLYTEMVHSHALLYGHRERLLKYSPREHPIALQVGGSDPLALKDCAQLATEFGFDEINLNVGCPSERVQSGEFGACLFKQPARVAAAVAKMNSATSIPVTVKTRIGVDDHDSYQHLVDFIEQVAAAGCKTFIIHARKAWLKGLNPKQNREIPPLQYPVVYQLKADYPELEIIINGGIKTTAAISDHLRYSNGAMIGREAYANPYLFTDVDQQFYHTNNTLPKSRHTIVTEYLTYVKQELAAGSQLRALLKPLIGLYQGQANAKSWRRCLTELTGRDANEVIDKIYQFI